MANDIQTFEESFFKDVFDAASIGMAIVSPEGKWLKVNDAVLSIVGYSAEELVKMTFQDITHPDDLEKDLQFVEEMLIGKRQKYYMEKRYFHKDGHVVYVGLSVSLVRNQEGEPEFFVSQIQNLTEEKKHLKELEQEREKQQRILSSVLSGVYIYNVEKKQNTYINSRYTELTGWTLDEINEMGERFLELFHPDELPTVLDHMKAVTNGKSGELFELTYRFKKKDGTWTWLMSHDGGFDYDENGNLKSFIGSFIEVNQLIEEEQEKEQEINELEIVNQAMINREVRMKELKKEVDELRHALGKEPKYT